MKKLFMMLLAAVLLCGAALAEETFSFREGLQWGMSPDEVQAIEGEFDDLYNTGGTEDIALIYGGQYGDLTTDLRYMFVNNRLCAFAVDATDPKDTEALSQSLTAEYGEPVDAVPYLVDKFVTNSEVEIIRGWQPAADAYIALIGTDGIAFGLFYFDPSVDFWAAENGEEPETDPAEAPAAPAEPTAAGPAFFSGLYMGMTPAEVEKDLGLAFDMLDEDSGMTMGLMQDFVMDGVDCETMSMFYKGGLCLFSIGNIATPEDMAVLKASLISAYGEPSADHIPYLVDKFTGNSGVTVIAGWQTVPGVYAAIIDAYGDEAIYFFDTAIDYWAILNGEEPETEPEETAAEPADVPPAPAGAFTFRGLRWGMTPEEVQAVEGKFSEMEAASYTLSGGFLEGARVSKFDAEMIYYFIENSLAGTAVNIYTSDAGWEADADYLVQALTILYGEPRDAAAMPDSLYQLFFAEEEPDELYVWLPAEDTCIFLTCDEWWEEVAIGYFNHTHDWLYHMQTTEPVTIDTTGL